MIYLKDLNVIFIKPRKVAGTSFEIALSRYAGPDDILTPISEEDELKRRELGYRGSQNYLKKARDYRLRDVYRYIRDKRPIVEYRNHMSAAAIKDALGAEAFDAATKISIVRNPFDMLVSLFYWRRSINGSKIGSFEDFVARKPELSGRNAEQYFIDGEYVIDHMVQYERMQDDCLEIERAVPGLTGLAASMSTISAKSGVRPKDREVSDYFNGDSNLISAVVRHNKTIIEKFGYSYSK